MNTPAITRHKKYKPALPLTELLVTFTIAQGVIADGFLFACAKEAGFIIAKTISLGVAPPGPSGNINFGKTLIQ